MKCLGLIVAEKMLRQGQAGQLLREKSADWILSKEAER